MKAKSWSLLLPPPVRIFTALYLYLYLWKVDLGWYCSAAAPLSISLQLRSMEVQTRKHHSTFTPNTSCHPIKSSTNPRWSRDEKRREGGKRKWGKMNQLQLKRNLKRPAWFSPSRYWEFKIIQLLVAFFWALFQKGSFFSYLGICRLLWQLLWQCQRRIHQQLHNENAQNLWTCKGICYPPKLWILSNQEINWVGECCSLLCWINTESCWRPSTGRWLGERERDCPHTNYFRLAPIRPSSWHHCVCTVQAFHNLQSS